MLCDSESKGVIAFLIIVFLFIFIFIACAGPCNTYDERHREKRKCERNTNCFGNIIWLIFIVLIFTPCIMLPAAFIFLTVIIFIFFLFELFYSIKCCDNDDDDRCEKEYSKGFERGVASAKQQIYLPDEE